MEKFLSNDRKIILKSAAAGVGLIAVLQVILSAGTQNEFLLFFAALGVLAVYWCIPTWFTRSSQLETSEMKCSAPEYIEANESAITCKNSIANCKEKENFTTKNIITIIWFLIINTLLIGFIYDELFSRLGDNYPSLDHTFTNICILLDFATPYLIRHVYCFYLNRPMDTNTLKMSWGNAPYIHKYNDNCSRNTATNPAYSYLSYNIYHRR